jgi:hypothetical protein
MNADGHEWIEHLPAELDGQRAILRRLLRACESTASFRWLAVACSVGRGAADHLSDLDLGIGIADDQFADAMGDVRRAVDDLGDLVDSYHHKLPGLTMPHERIFAQYADRCQVDLVVFLASQPVGPVLGQVVLYDPDKAFNSSFVPDPVTSEQAREWAFGGWCALADFGKYLRRGSAWEALQRLNDARGQVWQLWATGYAIPNPQYGLTSILDFAPERIPPGMAATVSDLDPGRLLAAARSLAGLLAEAGDHLPSDHRAALPAKMGAFVTADLAAIDLPAAGG